MSTTEKNEKLEKLIERSEKSEQLLKRKIKRKTKSRLIREIKNLQDYLNPPNLTVKNMRKINNFSKRSEESQAINNIEVAVKSKRGRKPQIINLSESSTIRKNKTWTTKKSLIHNCHKYFFETNCEEPFYNLNEILLFLKVGFGVDCENQILKDEQKQEFKVILNNFLKDYTTIYNSSQILIQEGHLSFFFEIISKFINFTSEDLLKRFEEISKDFKQKKIKETLEYIKSTAFVCENPIKIEEINKKKVGHYAKYKTIPKWHHYAWDMINQISNSRKSFIFSQFGIEEALSQEHSKRRIDLATITLKLKLKIYNNIFEFIDELMKMIKFSTDVNNRIGNSKNVTFCKMMETRMQKQVKKLKEENKI